VKIHTVGGYSEVGKNMTVVETGEDAFIFDCGLFLPPIVELEETERVFNERRLRNIGAVPNDKILPHNLKRKVRAIIPSHAHLDHIGGIPWLGHQYKAEVLGTPFTIEVLKTLYKDENANMRNQLKTMHPNSSYTIQGREGKYKIDFINITHSTIQTSMIALHTPKEGIFLYSNDFKLDNSPILGLKPNYDKLKEIAKIGVKAMAVDSLYSGDDRKTASEKVARSLLEDVMLTTTNDKAGMIITTFSSHIARLKSIVEFGKRLNREILFVGRSLNKYVSAARNIKMCPFAKDIRIASYRKQVEKSLKRVNKNRERYLVVCTGHQGEPHSVLDRMSRNQLPFRLNSEDHVIFSSSVIPTEVNIQNREQLDKKLKKRGVRIFNNVHVSGHAGREDLRDFVNMISPEHIIPAHAERVKLEPMMELCQELGYKRGKNSHLMSDGKRLVV
jgi:ribonuclease J